MAAEPGSLSDALSKLISMRGFARVQAGRQLGAMWNEIAGARIAAETRVIGISRGVLKVGVANAPLLSELVAFHRTELLAELNEQYPDINITGLKFLLRGNSAQ